MVLYKYNTMSLAKFPTNIDTQVLEMYVKRQTHNVMHVINLRKYIILYYIILH